MTLLELALWKARLDKSQSSVLLWSQKQRKPRLIAKVQEERDTLHLVQA